MAPEAGGGLLARFGLSAAQGEQIEALLGMLAEDEHAPTAIREHGQALERHVADSLVALELDELQDATCIADLGSGAGFPGLVLAIALPRASMALVESNARKAAFLGRARHAANAGNARVVLARAEEWEDGRGANDAVLARALAPQPVVLEYAAPLLRSGGALVDWRGRRSALEEHAADRACEQLGMRRVEVRAVQPFAAAADRHLHVFRKERETPSRYPRRAGIARKRPLG